MYAECISSVWCAGRLENRAHWQCIVDGIRYFHRYLFIWNLCDCHGLWGVIFARKRKKSPSGRWVALLGFLCGAGVYFFVIVDVHICIFLFVGNAQNLSRIFMFIIGDDNVAVLLSGRLSIVDCWDAGGCCCDRARLKARWSQSELSRCSIAVSGV